MKSFKDHMKSVHDFENNVFPRLRRMTNDHFHQISWAEMDRYRKATNRTVITSTGGEGEYTFISFDGHIVMIEDQSEPIYVSREPMSKSQLRKLLTQYRITEYKE